ncbi:MAG: type II secretion system F family protein [Planctomycetota bacterium]|jgi:type II secretory pathway component PulF
MKNYKYIVRDSSGQRKEGSKQAASSNDVLAYLREQGFIPISVSEIVTTKAKKTQKGSRKKRIKSAELAAIFWQMTTMVEGGIPITAALETIAEDIENLQLQHVLRQVLEKVEKGETFSDSLGQFPKIFNQLARAIILAGETGGNLPEALRRLAEYFENRDKLKKKVQGAMAYPIFVLVFIVLIVVFIMTFIIPRFVNIFDQMGGELPGFTKGFMGFYNIVRHNLHYIIGTVLLLVTLGIFTFKTRKGHYLFCKIALVSPLFGKIFRQSFVVTFCKTMSMLIASGVTVLEVFDILLTMTTNDIILNAITQTREQIVGGADISSSLSTSGFFPNMTVKMIQIGEESGSLSTVLERTAYYYERKVDSMITTLMTLLEPVMIVTVGGIVLVVVLALYLPIFTMS